MSHAVVDCRTGEVTVRPLTDDEQANLDDVRSSAEAEEAKRTQREDRRRQAVVRLEAFWANRASLSAAEVRTEAAFTARVLAKVLPHIDIDPE